MNETKLVLHIFFSMANSVLDEVNSLAEEIQDLKLRGRILRIGTIVVGKMNEIKEVVNNNK